MEEAYWAFNYLCKYYQMIQKRVPAGQKTGPGVLLSVPSSSIGQCQRRKRLFLSSMLYVLAHAQAQAEQAGVPQAAIPGSVVWLCAGTGDLGLRRVLHLLFSLFFFPLLLFLLLSFPLLLSPPPPPPNSTSHALNSILSNIRIVM